MQREGAGGGRSGMEEGVDFDAVRRSVCSGGGRSFGGRVVRVLVLSGSSYFLSSLLAIFLAPSCIGDASCQRVGWWERGRRGEGVYVVETVV